MKNMKHGLLLLVFALSLIIPEKSDAAWRTGRWMQYGSTIVCAWTGSNCQYYEFAPIDVPPSSN